MLHGSGLSTVIELSQTHLSRACAHMRAMWAAQAADAKNVMAHSVLLHSLIVETKKTQ
jgi:hypothetical protein